MEHGVKVKMVHLESCAMILWHQFFPNQGRESEAGPAFPLSTEENPLSPQDWHQFGRKLCLVRQCCTPTACTAMHSLLDIHWHMPAHPAVEMLWLAQFSSFASLSL